MNEKKLFYIDNSGAPIKVNYLSSKLTVSDRTIQKIIKELVNEGLIKVESCFINGRQSGNKITYIGKNRIKTGKELTLELLCDISILMDLEIGTEENLNYILI